MAKKAYSGWKGTIKAALDHHSDKFSKEACKDKGKGGKLCPYAIFTKKKEDGDTPHYKEQPSTLKGKPKKKIKENEESVCQCGHVISDHARNNQGRANLPCEYPDCDCENFTSKKEEGISGFKGWYLVESSSKEYQQGYGFGKKGHPAPCPHKEEPHRSEWLKGYKDGFEYANFENKDKPNWLNNEGWKNWVAGGLAAMSPLTAQASNPADFLPKPAVVAPSMEIKQIANNVYEVIGKGRASKIAGPTYAKEQAKKDATIKLLKHLNKTATDVNISTEPKELISSDNNFVIIKYKITLK